MRYKTTPANIFNPEIPFGGIFELFCGVGWDLCDQPFGLSGATLYNIPYPLHYKQ